MQIWLNDISGPEKQGALGFLKWEKILYNWYHIKTEDMNWNGFGMEDVSSF